MKIKAYNIEKSKSKEEIYNDGVNPHIDKEVTSTFGVAKPDTGFYIKPEKDEAIKKNLSQPHQKIDENGKKTTGDTEFKDDSLLEVPYLNHHNTIMNGQELIGYEEGKDQEINSSYLNNAKPLSYNKGLIESKIDGELNFTNIQDENIGLGKDGLGLLKSISGATVNSLGITNSDINDVVGAFKNIGFGNDQPSKYEESMNKLNNWRSKNYKEFHTFDWKPGQTIPQGILTNLALKMSNIDPVSQVRSSIKSSKGIYNDTTIDQSDISIQKENYLAESKTAKDSGTVYANWEKDPRLFSSWEKSDKETKYINALKNKNIFNKTLGYIYIKPNYEYSNAINNLNIPFEFNPDISEGGTQANYAVESLMNRIGQFHIYTSTSLSQLNINLDYIALAPDEIDDEMNNNMSKQFSTDSWQYYWTNNRIEQIEYQLRSLVMPDVTSADYLIKPPIIEIHLGNNNGVEAESVGDLFKYPIGIKGSNTNDKAYLSTTREVNNGTVSRYKKYIVTNVQISKITDDNYVWPSLYGRVWDKTSFSGAPINHIKTGKDIDETVEGGYSGYTRRTGFRATLQCTEITENFLDIVPDFKAYYDAWNYKREKANQTSEYAEIMLNEHLEETSDYLQTSYNTAIAKVSSLEERLESFFNEAYLIARLYKKAKEKNNNINDFNNQALGDDSTDKDGEYYFANSNWIIEPKPEPSKDEKIPENSPVLFKTELNTDIGKIINKPLDDETINNIINNGVLNNIDVPKIISKNNNLVVKLNEVSSNKGKEYLYDSKVSNAFEKDLLKFDDENYLKRYASFSKDKITYNDQDCYIIERIILDNVERYNKLISDNIDKGRKDTNSIIQNYLLKELHDIYGQETIEIPEDMIIENIYFNYLIPKFRDMLTDFESNKKTLYNETLKKLKITFKESGGDSNNEKKIEVYFSNAFNLYDIAKIVIEEPIYNSYNYNNITKLINSQLEPLYIFFRENTKIDNSVNAAKMDLIYVIKYLENYIENVCNFKEVLIKIIEEKYNSEVDSLTEVITSICNAMMNDSKVKTIRAKNIRLSCKIKDAATEKSKEVCEDNGEKYYIESYSTNKTNIKLLNLAYINNKLNDSYNDALKSTDKLKKEIASFNLKNVNILFYNDIENVTFVDIDSNDSYEEIRRKMHVNYENYVKLRDGVRKIKIGLSFYNIQNVFSKVAGYDKDTASTLENKNYVEKMKKLKDAYKTYSENENSIRENVYAEWDQLENLESTIGKDSEDFKNFEEKYKNSEECGQIPHMYYDKLTAQSLRRKMSIAGNSINNFDKLTT